MLSLRGIALVAAVLTSAVAAGPARAAGRTAPKTPPNFDVRAASTVGAAKSAKNRVAAQSRLRSSLGTSGVLDLDAVTGTVRSASRLSGTLTSASSADPATVARAWVRAHATGLGLSAADVEALGTPKTVKAPGGLTTLRFPQSVDGVPAFDSELRAAVDKHGRLVMVGGSPARDLSVASVTPAITAEAGDGRHQPVRRCRSRTGGRDPRGRCAPGDDVRERRHARVSSSS